MARRRSSGARWWWLAPPLIGVAAYLAFDATLGLVVPEEDVPRATRRRAPGAAAPAAPPAPDAAALAPPADPGALEPEPTPTASQARAAAPAGAARRKPGKQGVPRESLTDADRRALEDVLERTAREPREP